MGEKLEIFKALIQRDLVIKPINKVNIKRTPGDTTVVGHN
jgi:hypothetical protein